MTRWAVLALFVLSVPAVLGAADDTDPEPQGGGGATLKKLQGTWKAVRYISAKGKPKNPPTFTYTFSDDKVTMTFGEKQGPNTTIVPDRKRGDAFEFKRDTGKGSTKYFYKIEKGELYLVPNRSTDPKAKPDFSGTKTPVIIYQKEK